MLLKPGDIDAFLANPRQRGRFVLIFGPDEGAVAERAGRLARRLAGDDPMALVRLDGAALAQDAGRLSDEMRAIPLFGGDRVVWLGDAGGRSNLLACVEPLLEDPPAHSFLVIEAGDLKKGTGLRKRFEEGRDTIAIACYPDTAAELSRLISDEMARSGLTIDADARELLESFLGADRLASRGEIAKVALYAHGRGRVSAQDVAEAVGDASALALDDLVDAVAGGDTVNLDRLLSRMVLSGDHPSVLAGAVLRHFHQLQRLRARIDGGVSASEAVERAQPPIFFKRKSAFTAQLAAWPAARISRALALLDQALLGSRRQAALGGAIVSEALLQIARAARSARR